VEGFITWGVINYIRNARPEILENTFSRKPINSGVPIKKILILMGILSVITGGFFSWFASTNPDGLEWSIEKVFGKPELPEKEHGIAAKLKHIQEKTAFLPDYNFKAEEKEDNTNKKEPPSWPGVAPGTSLSGILGALLVLGFFLIVGFAIRMARKRKA
jgi:cobalt/nickel transport system permease protein